MGIGALIAAAASAAAKSLTANTAVSIAATKLGKGLDGVAYVRSLAKAGHWTPATHAARVFDAMAAGVFAPWRWVPVQVDPRLTVYVMHDALAIGDSPPARIAINESNCQRLADKLGKQIGATLLLPTPRISDAAHLAAIASGRAIDVVSIWNDPTEPKAPGKDKPGNQGQNVEQWLRQQERIQRAVAKAGGYPSSGVLSTVGKDVTLSPGIVDVARPGYSAPGEAGPRMQIYGWHTKQKPLDPPPSPNPGPFRPHSAAALAAKGWPGVQQGESTKHGDMDNGERGAGGFWDYSSILRLVHGTCLLDGAAANLADVYRTQPALVYLNATRPVPTRYPLVPVPVA